VRAIIETRYGPEQEQLAAQMQRYQSALAVFRSVYGPGPVSLYCAPGRVNLIGEHTDYSQGYVLPAALERDMLLLARPRADAQVRLANLEPRFAPRRFTIASQIPPQPLGDWGNYVQGPAQLLARRAGRPLLGMDALVCGRAPWGVPRGAGLSSSSALTVAAALALVHRNQVPLAGAELAAFCSEAEWYVGTRGGIMDHFAALLARQGHALFLDCRPENGCYRTAHVPLPEDHALVVMDSGERHRNTGPLYNQRVAEVRLGVRLLQARYPRLAHLRDLEGLSWEDYAELLPERVGLSELASRGLSMEDLVAGGIAPQADELLVRARCRHVVSENARVLAMVGALGRRDLAAVGTLLAASHASARDEYAISTPRLDALVDLARSVPGVVGARLTGAGWGGCALALAHADAAEALVSRVAATFSGAHAFVSRSAPGAECLLTTHC
jgi:galactokinase